MPLHSHKRRSLIVGLVTLAITGIIAYLSVSDILIASLVVPALLLLAVMIRKPFLSLALLIILTPLSSIEIVNTQIAEIPGLKVYNLLVLATVFSFVVGMKPVRTLKPIHYAFIGGLFFWFTIAIARSIPDVPYFNTLWEEGMDISTFIQSFFIKPLFYFVPFILILRYVGREEVRRIVWYMVISLFVFSVVNLIVYATIPAKLDTTTVRLTLGEFFGMHGNGLADFLIVVYPMLLATAVYTGSLFAYVTLGAALMSTAVLYSRTAYFVILFSTLLFFYISHRRRYLPIAAATAIIAIMLMPATVVERGMTGIESGDMNSITAGRSGDIWIPLVKEYLDDPVGILVGNGRYAILKTDMFKRQAVLEVTHAHNMYLDTALDSGLLGLGFFLLFFFAFYKRIRAGTKKSIDDDDETERYNHEMLYAIQVTMISYFLSGLTGRNMFPELTNFFFWIALALGLVIVGSEGSEEQEDIHAA